MGGGYPEDLFQDADKSPTTKLGGEWSGVDLLCTKFMRASNQ